MVDEMQVQQAGQQEELNPQEVLEFLRSDIEDLTKQRVDSEATFEKTWQYLRLRKADLYLRGLQSVAPDVSNGSPDYVPVGNMASGTSDSEQRGMFDYNIDIVRSLGRKYVGVLGLRPFYNAHAEPEDPNSETDRRAAGMANNAAEWLRTKWGIKTKNIEVFYHQWKAGHVCIYHPFIADADIFGTVEEEKMVAREVEVEPAGYRCSNCGLKSPEPMRNQSANDAGEIVDETLCPQCKQPLADYNYEPAQVVAVPEPQGTETYPGSGPALHITNGYFVTFPMDSRDLTRPPWFHFEYEENQGKLLQRFGEGLRKKINEGNAGTSALSANQGVQSRAMAASITATPRNGLANRWTYARTWLDTSMFEYIEDKQKRALLYKQFPDGLKIHKVADYIVKLENERAADVWDIIVPEPADTLYHDPQCWPILGHQDMKNDFNAIKMALIERGLPVFAVDPDVFSAEAFASKSYNPVEIVEAKPGCGARLDTAVKMFPAASYPEHMDEVEQGIDMNAQTITGLLPAVWGGGERQPTAEGQRTVLNQALMQLGVPGEYAQMGWASVFFKCCKLIEKYSPRGAKAPSGDPIDPEIMRAGKYHFEVEPGIPMSWAEKKDQLNSIISQNPELTQALGLTNPINAAVVRDYLLTNMPDLTVPDEDLRNYVMARIQVLIEGQPQEDPMGGPPQASIPPDEFVDPSIYQRIAQIAQGWLISAAGMKTQEKNLGGFKNVLAWAMANNMAGMPPPQPPEMGAPSGPPQPSAQGGGNGPPEPQGPDPQATGPTPQGPIPPQLQMTQPQQQ